MIALFSGIPCINFIDNRKIVGIIRIPFLKPININPKHNKIPLPLLLALKKHKNLLLALPQPNPKPILPNISAHLLKILLFLIVDKTKLQINNKCLSSRTDP